MNPARLGKEIIRIGTTAGLSKDVIDLLQTKLAIVTEEFAILSEENLRLKAENADLQHENIQLKQKLADLDPEQGLFTESMGALWKRSEDGYEPFPYCPDCERHPVMIHFADFFLCSRCDLQVPDQAKPPKG